MYELLKKFAVRPDPYSSMTVKALWTRPHVADQMLAFHLNQDTPLASRPIVMIDEMVDWLDTELGLAGKKICDLGCGPGLYARRFARRGARVTGVDFSRTAIAYAEAQRSDTDSVIDYLVADYLKDALPSGFDIVTLIYHDYCALSPTDRQALLRRIHAMLKPHGKLVMDVVATGAFRKAGEQLTIEENLMNGFWSDSDYVGIHRTWLYPDLSITLDHFAIVEPDGHWEIFNWMQYFSADRLVRELEQGGFHVRALLGSLSGAALTDGNDEIAVIAEISPSGK